MSKIFSNRLTTLLAVTFTLAVAAFPLTSAPQARASWLGDKSGGMPRGAWVGIGAIGLGGAVLYFGNRLRQRGQEKIGGSSSTAGSASTAPDTAKPASPEAALLATFRRLHSQPGDLSKAVNADSRETLAQWADEAYRALNHVDENPGLLTDPTIASAHRNLNTTYVAFLNALAQRIESEWPATAANGAGELPNLVTASEPSGNGIADNSHYTNRCIQFCMPDTDTMGRPAYWVYNGLWFVHQGYDGSVKKLGSETQVWQLTAKTLRKLVVMHSNRLARATSAAATSPDRSTTIKTEVGGTAIHADMFRPKADISAPAKTL